MQTWRTTTTDAAVGNSKGAVDREEDAKAVEVVEAVGTVKVGTRVAAKVRGECLGRVDTAAGCRAADRRADTVVAVVDMVVAGTAVT